MVKNTLFNYAVMRGDRSVLVPLPLFKKCCTSGHNYFSAFTIIFLHRQVRVVWATSGWACPASCSEATPPPSTAAGTWTSEGRYRFAVQFLNIVIDTVSIHNIRRSEKFAISYRLNAHCEKGTDRLFLILKILCIHHKHWVTSNSNIEDNLSR